MEMEEICFQIRSNVGAARSNYVEAIALAKKGKLDKAHKFVEEGDSFYKEAHHVHSDLIAQDAGDDKVVLSLILMHAEDQMMSAETSKIYACEFIDLYERLAKAGSLDYLKAD